MLHGFGIHHVCMCVYVYVYVYVYILFPGALDAAAVLMPSDTIRPGFELVPLLLFSRP